MWIGTDDDEVEADVSNDKITPELYRRFRDKITETIQAMVDDGADPLDYGFIVMAMPGMPPDVKFDTEVAIQDAFLGYPPKMRDAAKVARMPDTVHCYVVDFRKPNGALFYVVSISIHQKGAGS